MGAIMSHNRNIYLDKKTLNQARELVFNSFSLAGASGTEKIPVPEAVGRVLSKPVFALISSPNFHAAAMDGVAKKASATFGASENNPRTLTLGEDARYINTGHVIPEGFDAVIMIENINALDDQHIEIEAPAFPWQHIRKMGEDIVATELLFPRNHVVTPYCVGALITGGIFEVEVRKKPRVLVIPTGSELVDWRRGDLKALKPGQVLESNSYVLEKLVESCGGACTRHERVVDDPDKIKKIMVEAAHDNFNMILTIGGSSAGSEDYTKGVVQDLGRVLVHGVTIMPGKPVLIGTVKEKPVVGIPGYPVSAIIAFEQFVKPLILRILEQPDHEPTRVTVEPTRKIASKLGVEEFLRVKLGKVEERIVATPLPRGAGSITSITEAHGIIRIPNNIEGLKENEPVEAELLRPLPSIQNTIVAVGSHDNTLDLLADSIRATSSGLTLSSSHVGSMGGLMAIKRGACHMAGSHLLDTRDGTYNVSYIKRYLPDVEVKIVNLVFRDQGLMVPRGNPKNIKGIEDIGRGDITFINRQQGSGTRILLDYRIDQLGLEPTAIKGYENDEFTHMSVAVAVLSGTADAGLGIFAAARALNLDFVPVVTEQYDLVVPSAHFDSKNFQFLLKTIRSADFKKQVEQLGGYHTEKTGEVTSI
jgi:putative molybdopterin biosynthesis protein